MSHTAPDLRACPPKWPHCLWGWHSALQGQPEKESSGAGESWEGNSSTFRGSKWYSPALDQSPGKVSAGPCQVALQHSVWCQSMPRPVLPGLGWVRAAGRHCLKVVLF